MQHELPSTALWQHPCRLMIEKIRAV
jgi:hypothetical protein